MAYCLVATAINEMRVEDVPKLYEILRWIMGRCLRREGGSRRKKVLPLKEHTLWSFYGIHQNIIIIWETVSEIEEEREEGECSPASHIPR